MARKVAPRDSFRDDCCFLERLDAAIDVDKRLPAEYRDEAITAVRNLIAVLKRRPATPAMQGE